MANYHVDYLNGSNVTGDGAAGNPWGTVSFALTESSAGTGDTVKVAGSGLTLADATATFSTNNTLTTTTDLQGVISVGDLVNVSPNGVADYVDWPTLYVTAITATTISFYENIYMPGDWRLGTSTYTIKTIGDMYISNAASIETFTNELGAGSVVEGGYDPTFTSIVGLTRFRRGGMGSGSASGYGWVLHQTTNNPNVVTFKNLFFAQFNRAWSSNFGASFIGTNLHSYGANGRGFTYFGNIVSLPADGAAKIYLSNSTGAFQNNYISNFWDAGYDSTIELYQLGAQRFIAQESDCTLTKAVTWNVGQSGNSEEFGSTMNLRTKNEYTFKNATIVSNIIENDFSPTYHKALTLWSSARGVIDNLTIIDGNTTEKYYYLHYLSGESATGESTWRNTVKLPTGYDLTASSVLDHMSSSRDADKYVIKNPTSHMLIDTNGRWMAQPGTLQKTNTTVYDTGTSSRQILLGSRDAYSKSDPSFSLVEIEKVSATPPTSVTVRYLVPGGTGFGSRLYFSDLSPADFTTQNQQLTPDNTWRDLVFPVNTLSNERFARYWAQLPIGSYYQITFTPLFYGQIPRELFIDSVAVTY